MNASDPLAQLRDIHLPDSVGFWPLAWGWWALIALLLGVGGAGLYVLLRRRRRNRYRQQAQSELKAALARYQQTGDTAQYLQELSVVLRRAALTAFPAQSVAGLRNRAWLGFLDDTLPENRRPFSEGPGLALLHGPYQPQPEADVQSLHQLATSWVAKHRRKRHGEAAHA